MNNYCKRILEILDGELPVIICVGTDLIGGDCLGPLVGRMLIDKNVPTYVYGTFSYLVNAVNVVSVDKFVRRNHKNRKVLVIDSCVGKKEEIGKIIISDGGLYPAAASGKNLPQIGDYSISAVMTDARPTSKDFAMVRLGFVFDIARTIADAVADAVSSLNILQYKSISIK